MKITGGLLLGLGLSLTSVNAQLSHPSRYEGSMQQRSSVSSGGLLEGPIPTAPVVYTPRDPLRVFGTNVYRISGVSSDYGWVGFEGTVSAFNSESGILVLNGTFSGSGGSVTFCVTNFPYPLGAGQKIVIGQDQMYCIARLAGTHMVQSYNGQTSVAMLDYGHVFVPKPLSDEERQALADKTRHNREAAAVKALKANQDAADKGDAYGLMRMGERYRDGDGVDKDTDKARDYLKRAADAGSPTAQTELASLPQAASGLATEK